MAPKRSVVHPASAAPDEAPRNAAPRTAVQMSPRSPFHALSLAPGFRPCAHRDRTRSPGACSPRDTEDSGSGETLASSTNQG